MLPKKHDFTFKRGDGWTITISATTAVDGAFDLNGSRLILQVRKHPDAADAIQTFDMSYSGTADEGIFQATVDANTTADLSIGRFVYDAELILSGLQPMTIAEGAFNITSDTSRIESYAGSAAETASTLLQISVGAGGSVDTDLVNATDIAVVVSQFGADGLSAYEVWLSLGNTGTETDFINNLRGTDGVDGTNGTDGLSAYQIAVNNGFVGTEAEWLTNLQGADGIDGTDGINGLSAYQIAVNNGFTGTESEWIASLTYSANEFLFQDLEIKELQFRNALADISYDGGWYDLFVNEDNIATKDNILVSNLYQGRNTPANIQIADPNAFLDFSTATANEDKLLDVGSGSPWEMFWPGSIQWVNNGQTFLLMAYNNLKFYSHTASTPYEIDFTDFDYMVDLRAEFGVSNEAIRSFHMNEQGTKLWLYFRDDAHYRGIIEYDIINYDIRTRTEVRRTPLNIVLSDFGFNHDGTEFWCVDLDWFESFSLTTPYVVDLSNSNERLDINPSVGFVRSLEFFNNGKQCAVFYNNAGIQFYNCNTPYRLSDATLDVFVNAQTEWNLNQIYGITFNADSSVMYVASDSRNAIGVVERQAFNKLGLSVRDLSNQLTQNPTKVILSADVTVPANTRLYARLSDGVNSVEIESTQFDQEVLIPFTSYNALSLEFYMNSFDSVSSPILRNYGVYLK